MGTGNPTTTAVPAPMYHNNGTAYCGCNNGAHEFQIYRSDNPAAEGSWQEVSHISYPNTWHQNGCGGKACRGCEDPYLWMSHDGSWVSEPLGGTNAWPLPPPQSSAFYKLGRAANNYSALQLLTPLRPFAHAQHFLAHRYDYRDGWPPNPAHTQPVLVSGHGFSTDGLHWHFNDDPPYGNTRLFENGTVQHFATLERPHLLFDDEQRPTHLINGASAYWGAQPCDVCDHRPGSPHSCVVCKTCVGLGLPWVVAFCLRFLGFASTSSLWSA